MSNQRATTCPAESVGQLSWYVARTQPRHEKTVALQLNGRGVDHFLPLYESVSVWKDRRAKVRLPLFPGYVFVHFTYDDRMRALEIPSVIELVSFGGKPAAVHDEEIAILQRGFDAHGLASPHPFLTAGTRVRIATGPFAGLTGIIQRTRGVSRVIVSIDQIQRSIAIHLDGADIEPVPSSRKRHTA